MNKKLVLDVLIAAREIVANEYPTRFICPAITDAIYNSGTYRDMKWTDRDVLEKEVRGYLNDNRPGFGHHSEFLCPYYGISGHVWFNDQSLRVKFMNMLINQLNKEIENEYRQGKESTAPSLEAGID